MSVHMNEPMQLSPVAVALLDSVRMTVMPQCEWFYAATDSDDCYDCFDSAVVWHVGTELYLCRSHFEQVTRDDA